MSLRYLYRQIPPDKRICSYWRCGKPILRNLAKHNGQLYHYGCLNSAKDEHYKCLDCFSTLNGTEVHLTDFGGPRPTLCCGNCGSTQLKPAKRLVNGTGSASRRGRL